ncbi:MAG: hypothetical protein N2559_15080 [Anaerolineae bacterium]|nr:hypothetical protein [Anaerolineae bacterium]
MIPGPDEIIACPHCGSLARRHTLLSGNTFGAHFWTDGKMLAPMLPEFPAITRCAQCVQLYWVEDAQVVGEEQYGEPIPEEWKRAQAVRELTRDEFREALQTGLGNNAERELHLRVHYWWACNDPLREAETAPIPPDYSDWERENFARLLELLDAHAPGERLMMAEIHRETGNFDAALQLIQDTPESHRAWAETLAAHARQGDRVVRQIPYR